MIFELIQDLSAVLKEMPDENPGYHILSLLEEAIRRDSSFIARHPTTLFQCMWNSCWWYDCLERGKYYVNSSDSRTLEDSFPKISPLIENWRSNKEQETPGFRWLRAVRPLHMPLNTELKCLFLRALGKTGQILWRPREMEG